MQSDSMLDYESIPKRIETSSTTPLDREFIANEVIESIDRNSNDNEKNRVIDRLQYRSSSLAASAEENSPACVFSKTLAAVLANISMTRRVSNHALATSLLN